MARTLRGIHTPHRGRQDISQIPYKEAMNMYNDRKTDELTKPEFRLQTTLVGENGKIYIEKKAADRTGVLHLEQIRKNYVTAKEMYRRITPVPCVPVQGALRFPRPEGKPLFDISECRGEAYREVISRLNEAMDVVFDLNQDYLTEFVREDRFTEYFGPCRPEEGSAAVKYADMSLSLTELICSEEKISRTDYEWILPAAVPVRFLKYHVLLRVYNEAIAAFFDKRELYDYLKDLGFTDAEEIEIYADMERHFTEYRNLSRRVDAIRYAPVRRMVSSKEIHDRTPEELAGEINDLKRVISGQQMEIFNLETRARASDQRIMVKDRDAGRMQTQIQILRDSLGNMKKGIVNPVYGIKMASEKALNHGREIKRRRLWNEYRNHYEERYRRLTERYNAEQERSGDPYEAWIRSKEEKYTAGGMFSYNPKISVIVPVYNTEDRHLIPCIESVLKQTYTNWELCIADDNSNWENVRMTLERYREKDARIKVVYRKENGHISECSNDAMRLAEGEFAAYLDCDDTLSPDALYEVVKLLNKDPSLDLIYSDEDKIDDDGNHRHDPAFKPDWSPDLLMSCMYTGHLSVYRKSIVDELGGLRSEYDGSQDHDLALRFTEKTDRVGHIPKILYHWRERKGSTSLDIGAKDYTVMAGKKAREDALKRRGQKGLMEYMETTRIYRVRYLPQKESMISIVIPSKDHPEILRQCISSLKEKTLYGNYEIIVVDNGSSEENRKICEEMADTFGYTYLYRPMEFNFSAMCNIGAAKAAGEYLLFLNDDIEIIEGQWLDRMLGHAQTGRTGTVGAKLLYPGTTKIQHAGIINIKTGPSHALIGMDDRDYHFNKNCFEQDMIAVTAACMMIRKELFEQLGGFDEELAVAYNDVDLCFRTYKAGYYNVLRNDVYLYHHESLSREKDSEDGEKMKRLMAEQEILFGKHPDLRGKDPFYNENLTQKAVDYSYGNETTYRSKIKEISAEGPEGARETDQILFDAGNISVDDHIEMSGWAFVTGSMYNIDNRIKIMLLGREKSYICSTRIERRTDVADLFNDQTGIEFCGFTMAADRDKIEKGSYETAILIGRKYIRTGRSLTV